MVERFLQAGHHVTLLTRGNLASPFVESKQCTHLVADRNEQVNGKLAALEGKTFDAVVDVSGYIPHQVQRILDTVQFTQYLFVSTISVYDPTLASSFAELGITSEPNWDALEVTPATYGPLKRACELLLQQHIPEKLCIVRPHFVVGSFDYTQRFNSWIHRLALGGPRAFAGPLSNALQFVDARDHADFALLALERNLHGIFNLARDPLTWGDLATELERQTQRPLEAVVLSADFMDNFMANFMAKHLPDGDPFPMWIDSSGDAAPFVQVPNAAVKATGFEFRTLEQSVQHLLEWNAAQVDFQDAPPKVGLSAEQESLLLERWFAQRA
jgi:2'-hydroxyisoflavone reductase